MSGQAVHDQIREQLAEWRAFVARRDGVSAGDVDELEDHLLATVDRLSEAGLSPDEAFLVAVRRLGRADALAQEFAREHSDRLWKQLVLGETEPGRRTSDRRGLVPMLVFAVLAGLAVRLPVAQLAAGAGDGRQGGVLLGWAILALAAVSGAYAVWLRRPVSRGGVASLVGLLVALGLANALFPFAADSQTQPLFVLHAAITLAVVLAAVYVPSGWRGLDRWLDWVRFVGEFLVYYVLIALVGGGLVAIAAFSFQVVGVDAERALTEWVLPLGAGGAVIVAAWLVEAKKSVVENMAPVLAAVFTPLVTVLLAALLAGMLTTRQFADADRGLLIAIDLLLVVVWGLVLFSVSARPTDAAPRAVDWLLAGSVVVALVIDVIVLVAMAGRIGEFGASPNKLAALGENVVLAVNLAWTAWLFVGFLRGRRPFGALAGWQARYLPVVGAWALVVALLLPALFAFA